MNETEAETLRRGIEIMTAAQDSPGFTIDTFQNVARDEGLDGVVQAAYGLVNVCTYLLLMRDKEVGVSPSETLQALGALTAGE